ncbi:MAG TPA: hypothetical protein VFR67_17160 [Pilimelia sp.]|nr:hypothetical protein [Pilimelia sp.]
MTINAPAAVSFMTTHGRVLDRRRLQLLLGDANPPMLCSRPLMPTATPTAGTA